MSAVIWGFFFFFFFFLLVPGAHLLSQKILVIGRTFFERRIRYSGSKGVCYRLMNPLPLTPLSISGRGLLGPSFYHFYTRAVHSMLHLMLHYLRVHYLNAKLPCLCICACAEITGAKETSCFFYALAKQEGRNI
jgi:hypothetical protein